MLINLKKTEEELWSQLTQSLRTDIRKALNNGLSFTTDMSESDFERCCELYLFMMKKTYTPVEKNFKEVLKGKKVLLIKKGDTVVSYMFFNLESSIDKLGKTNISAYENTATDDEYKHMSPNSLLYWRSILYMKSLGFEYLNFTGCFYQYGEEKLNNLAFFKRKWNGLEIECVSRKSLAGYIYWRFFRRFEWVRKMTYIVLVNVFQNKYLKY